MSSLPLPVNPHNLVRVRKWVKVRAVIVTLCVREVMIFIPFLSSVSLLGQEQLGECAGKALCYSDAWPLSRSFFAFRIPSVMLDWPSPQARRTGKDWTPASGKGVRKDGCLYPSDQQGQWSREERWSVADGAR